MSVNADRTGSRELPVGAAGCCGLGRHVAKRCDTSSRGLAPLPEPANGTLSVTGKPNGFVGDRGIISSKPTSGPVCSTMMYDCVLSGRAAPLGEVSTSKELACTRNRSVDGFATESSDSKNRPLYPNRSKAQSGRARRLISDRRQSGTAGQHHSRRAAPCCRTPQP